MCYRTARIVKVVLPVVVLIAISLQASTDSEALTAQPQGTRNLTTRQSAGIGTAHHADSTHPQVQGGDGPDGPYQYFFPLIAHSSPSEKLAVFPGAEGFGTDTPAGRGGKIIRVTTLADSGPGSLREAISTRGPRTIVFEVGGMIWLSSDLNVWHPFLTIAGQTAPSPGITLVNATFRIKTHDVLIQHLHIRPGDKAQGSQNGLAISGKTDGSDEVYNVVIDHCSISWAVNKNLIIWTTNEHLSSGVVGVHDVTVSNCIVSESLFDPPRHYMGFLISDHSKRIAVIGNLFAHQKRRNPAPFGDTSTVIVNNVVYNPGTGAIHFQDSVYTNGPLISSVVGNVIIFGRDTAEWCHPITVLSRTAPGTRIYLEDNKGPGTTSNPWSIASVGTSFSVKATEPPIWVDPLTVRKSDEVLDWVLANAGAWPWDRDAVDKRIVSNVRNGTGRIIDTQRDVGGWPDLASTERPLDLPADPNGDDDGDGYTNLEEWLFEFGQLPPTD